MSDLTNANDFEVERATYTNYMDKTSETDATRIVADGGTPAHAKIAADQEILDAVERHVDPDGPRAATFVEVHDLLAAINTDIVESWETYSDMLDDGIFEIVHESRGTIILAGHDNFWSGELDGYDVDDVVEDIVIDVHQKVAQKCDYSWSESSPVVVRKPYAWQLGETHVLHEIARRTAKQGSTSRGLDQYAVKAYGYSQRLWASLTGRNESTVSRTVRGEE